MRTAIPQNVLFENTGATALENSDTANLAYSLHAPILIDAISDFGMLDFSGDGTPETPYIIEDLETLIKERL